MKDLTSLKRLDVYIEIDPSSTIFKGFRQSETAYTEFASALFKKTIAMLPVLEEVRFAGYSDVSLGDSLLAELIADTKQAGKTVSFGGH